MVSFIHIVHMSLISTLLGALQLICSAGRCPPSSARDPGESEDAEMPCPRHWSITALHLQQRLLSHNLLCRSFTLQFQQLVGKVCYKYVAGSNCQLPLQEKYVETAQPVPLLCV